MKYRLRKWTPHTLLLILCVLRFDKSFLPGYFYKNKGKGFILEPTTSESTEKNITSSIGGIIADNPRSNHSCLREQIRNGKWTKAVYSRPPYVSHTTHLRCMSVEFYMSNPWETWEWSPSEDCLFDPFEETDFCSLLPFATVSIIGDSLSWEMYSSMLQLLGARVRQSDQHKSKNHDKNHVQMACGGRTKFVWRNDARLLRVADSIDNDFPSVLVLNRGAHYEHDNDLVNDMKEVLEVVREWLELCDENEIKCHFFWRTTVPGHPHCANFTKPVNDLGLMESYVGDLDNYDNQTVEFNWFRFKHQNEIVLDMISNSSLAYEVIDAYHLNMRRPDGHRINTGDCLHNCYPGKMDVYAQILQHFLGVQRSKSDVLRMETLFREAIKRQRTKNSTK